LSAGIPGLTVRCGTRMARPAMNLVQVLAARASSLGGVLAALSEAAAAGSLEETYLFGLLRPHL
jgi:hypothetical protein